MRKCFIHIGTHKTGTTAIQHLLNNNSSALQERGYLYPQAGRLESLPGHHNLAWEISGDDRFRNHYGTIDDLIREVKHSSEDMILSSEDLGCSLHHSSKFSDFISLLQSCGFLVTVILYVRNQIHFLPRLYLTLVRSFGLDSSFDDVLRPTRETGKFRWRGWIFNFDYCDVLKRIGENADVNVIVRSYDLAGRSICGDFLSIFDLTLRDLHVDDEIFANMSLPVRDYLRMFLNNKLDRELFEAEEEAVQRVVPPEYGKIELSLVATLALFQEFYDTNRKLFIQYGIPEPKMEDTDGERHCPDPPYIDKLFTENMARYVSKPPIDEALPKLDCS